MSLADGPELVLKTPCGIAKRRLPTVRARDDVDDNLSPSLAPPLWGLAVYGLLLPGLRDVRFTHVAPPWAGLASSLRDHWETYHLGASPWTQEHLPPELRIDRVGPLAPRPTAPTRPTSATCSHPPELRRRGSPGSGARFRESSRSGPRSSSATRCRTICRRG